MGSGFLTAEDAEERRGNKGCGVGWMGIFFTAKDAKGAQSSEGWNRRCTQRYAGEGKGPGMAGPVSPITGC